MIINKTKTLNKIFNQIMNNNRKKNFLKIIKLIKIKKLIKIIQKNFKLINKNILINISNNLYHMTPNPTTILHRTNIVHIVIVI